MVIHKELDDQKDMSNKQEKVIKMLIEEGGSARGTAEMSKNSTLMDLALITDCSAWNKVVNFDKNAPSNIPMPQTTTPEAVQESSLPKIVDYSFQSEMREDENFSEVPSNEEVQAESDIRQYKNYS